MGLQHKVSIRCNLVAVALPIVIFGAWSISVTAAEMQYPNKSVRWIVPFVASGGVDNVVRRVATKISDKVKIPIVVDNRGGAAGTIGAEIAKSAPPDGYTLLAISSTLAVNQAIRKESSYDLVRDFAPITQMTTQPYIFTVHSSVPARSIAELIALAKSKPNSLNYASSGTGGTQHLAGAMLAKMGGVEMVHIPYKGGGAAHNDLVAGHIQVEVTLPISTYEQVKAGRLRYLAVTSLKRLKAFPDIPTVAETLPGYEIVAWYGVVAPAKTPRQIVSFLHREIVEILQMPEVGGWLTAAGTDPVGSDSAEFGDFISKELTKWRSIAKLVGFSDK